MLVADFTASDGAYVALAVFLVLVGLGLAYALWRLGSLLRQLSTTVQHTEVELLPVLNKSGGTLDRVNVQLDRADVVTESAADAVLAVSRVVRATSAALAVPIQGLAGVVEGIRYAFSSLKTKRDVGEAVNVGREAAQRRVDDLAEELGETPQPPREPPPPPAA
ncbi:MAG TPA: hypothetical protein VGF10_05915 [Gaiella sp.]